MHTHSLSIHPDPGRALRPWELALLLAVCVTLLTGTWAQARSQLLVARLVRLHVIAVSDDDAEQAVKLQVRDAVLAYLEPQLAAASEIRRRAVACYGECLYKELGASLYPLRAVFLFSHSHCGISSRYINIVTHGCSAAVKYFYVTNLSWGY